MTSESSVFAGTSDMVFHLFIIGFHHTKFHIYFEKLPNSFWISIKAFAFFIVDLTLSLFLIIPSFCSNS